MEEKVRDISDESETTTSVLDQIMIRTGMDLRTFARKETYVALGIGFLLFSLIAYAGLSVFGISSTMFAQSGESIPIDELEFQTLNRTGIEDNITNDTGWFRLSEHQGKVVILDMMAHDCSNCHGVQARIEDKMSEWHSLSDERELIIIGYGSYYSESLEYLNSSGGEYTVPLYPTGLGSTTAAVVNGTERASLAGNTGTPSQVVLANKVSNDTFGTTGFWNDIVFYNGVNRGEQSVPTTPFGH